MRGGLWTLGSQGMIVAIQFSAIPILTRLLDPTDFGLVAMVTVFMGFSTMFVDAGLSMSTVQREEITHQQVSNLFWLAAGLGLVVSLMIVAAAPAIAWFYSEPRLIPISLALATTPLLAGLTIQHQALLRRTMKLRQLSLIHVLGTLFSYLLAVTIAWIYRSYWALVVLTISVAALRTLGTWIACRWWPSLPKRGAGIRSMVGFGANLTGFSFVNYFARSGDNMLIGWWWGAEPLGFYERAYKLMMAPLQQVNSPLSGVMIPALSRLAGQPEKYRDAYFQAIAILQIVSCPIMAFVAVMAPQIVDVVFGRGYEEAGPILRWLAIAGSVQTVGQSLGWLYISQGRGRDMMVWGIIASSLVILSFLIGLPWGPVGVARAYAVLIWLIIVPVCYYGVGRRGPITMLDLLQSTAVAVVYAMPTIIASLLVVYRFPTLPSPAGIALSGTASLIASLTALVSTKVGRQLASDNIRLLQATIAPTIRKKLNATPLPRSGS